MTGFYPGSRKHEIMFIGHVNQRKKLPPHQNHSRVSEEGLKAPVQCMEQRLRLCPREVGAMQAPEAGSWLCSALPAKLPWETHSRTVPQPLEERKR